jgi:hypothetical protein
MPDGGFDQEAKYAQLGERVENQSRQIGDLDNRMGKGFSEVPARPNRFPGPRRQHQRTFTLQQAVEPWSVPRRCFVTIAAPARPPA